jgi:hypothetical protein
MAVGRESEAHPALTPDSRPPAVRRDRLAGCRDDNFINNEPKKADPPPAKVRRWI